MTRPSYTLHRQNSSSTRSGQSDVFADRHAIDDMSPVDRASHDEDAAGRSRRASTSTRGDDYVDADADPHYADGFVESSQALREARRNSMRKSRGDVENPFGGERGPSGRPAAYTDAQSTYGYGPGGHDGTGDRSSFSTTNANGPSYPYGQFAQNTSSSHANPGQPLLTAQTIGRQSLHGPSHQYTMYPQNVEEDIDDTASQAPPNHNIPMGFPPTLLNGGPYQHDMEHLSEQLPPYSEYPEGGAPKHVVVPSRTAVLPTTSELSTPTRAPQSMSDAVQSTDPASDQEEIVPASEKRWRDKSWKQKRKTKFCGVPFGWILLVAGVFTFIVIVLAATIGGFFGSQAKEQAELSSELALIDASPLATNMPPLLNGSYQLQLSPPQEVQADCLTDPSQSASWDCSVSAPGALAINIGPGPNGEVQGAWISQANANLSTGYGTELPHTVWSALRPVKDLDAPNRGPAYHFQAVYTKIVVARQDAFQPAVVNRPQASPGPSGSSSTSPAPSASSSSRKTKRGWSQLAQAGDQPWVCFWNNTLIEGFIYVDENSTSWYGDGSGSDQASTPSTTGGAAAATGAVNATPTTSGPTTASPASPSSPAASACTWISGTAHPANPAYTPSVCPPALGDDPWSKLQFYPFVVKIEERRVPGDQSQSYCQKMQVLNDGTLGFLQDASGNPYKVQLSELNPDITAYQTVYPPSSRKMRSKMMRRGEEAIMQPVRNAKRAVVNGECHCQWTSGENGDD